MRSGLDCSMRLNHLSTFSFYISLPLTTGPPWAEGRRRSAASLRNPAVPMCATALLVSSSRGGFGRWRDEAEFGGQRAGGGPVGDGDVHVQPLAFAADEEQEPCVPLIKDLVRH